MDIMATETETRQDQKTRKQILPPWRVLLHNDDVNDMVHVVRALLRSVPSLSVERATQVMLEAHLHGVAQVIICPHEHAELYRERLEGHGLTSTIEPV
jgi:ATP-dependent Clp protease adaptor protein ClpS